MTREFNIFAAVLSGQTLMEASAGTGKTHSLSGLYLRCLLEMPNTPIESLLVVTYTEAATLDLKTRIRAVLTAAITAFAQGHSDDDLLKQFLEHYGEQRCLEHVSALKYELRNFDQSSIFTIHGFCLRLLQDYAFETGNLFDTVLEPDISDLVRQTADRFWRENVLALHRGFVAFLAQRRLTPDVLLDELATWLHRPGITSIPTAPIPDFEESFARWDEAASGLRQQWEASGDELVRQLMDADERGELKRNRVAKLMRHVKEASDWLRGRLDTPPADALASLTTTNIESCTRKGGTPLDHPFFVECEHALMIFQSWQATLDAGLIALRRQFIEYMQANVPATKELANVMSYDDLLTRVHAAVTSPELGRSLVDAVRTRFRVAMIDEFQDTDPLQLDIVRTLFHSPNHAVFFIGDPKQAIYSFRGADVFTYLDAKSTTQRQFTLGTNWRSESCLIAAVNRLFGQHEDPFVLDNIPYLSVACGGRADHKPITEAGVAIAPMHLWMLPADNGGTRLLSSQADDMALQAVAGEIARLLSATANVSIGDTPIAASDIAILVRTNDQAVRMKKVLDSAKIPAVMQSTQSLFASSEVLGVMHIVTAVANPRDESRVRAALATDELGLAATEIESLLQDETAWEDVITEFREYHELWRQGEFIHMFRTLLRRRRVRQRLLNLRNGERRITNVLHAGEVLHRAIEDHHLGIRGAIDWLYERITDERSQEEYELRLARDSSAVTILTVHKSKGLQFPVVFIPFAWTAARRIKSGEPFGFHRHDESGASLVLDLGSKDRDRNIAVAELEQAAEDVRLLYVALTRAVNRCYLIVANGIADSATSRICTREFFDSIDAVSGSNVNTPEDPGSQTKKFADADLFTVAELPLSEVAVTKPESESTSADLDVRVFNGAVDRSWRVVSFSYLAHTGLDAESPDHDAIALGSPPVEVAQRNDCDRFSYPAGPMYGTLLHEIFELYDYSDPNLNVLRDIVEKKHKEHGVQHLSAYYPVVVDMVTDVVSAPLDPENSDLRLCHIPLPSRRNELEFYHPLRRMSRNELAAVFAQYGVDAIATDFPLEIERLRFHPVQGMMKGYIDLLFEHDDRYYIVDWKSNRLGWQWADYARDGIVRAMHESRYVLQYHLYAVALHLYLKQRLPRYNYERNFGGVYYLFIRGISSSQSPENGIYRDRPPRALIEALARFTEST